MSAEVKACALRGARLEFVVPHPEMPHYICNWADGGWPQNLARKYKLTLIDRDDNYAVVDVDKRFTSSEDALDYAAIHFGALEEDVRIEQLEKGEW